MIVIEGKEISSCYWVHILPARHFQSPDTLIWRFSYTSLNTLYGRDLMYMGAGLVGVSNDLKLSLDPVSVSWWVRGSWRLDCCFFDGCKINRNVSYQV